MQNVARPHIDALHEVQPKSTISYYQVGKSLAGRYDAVIDPTLSLRPRDLLLLRVLNAAHYVGLGKADYRLFTHNIQNSQQHFADVYAQALRLLGFDRINTQPELPTNPASEAAVQDFLQQNGLQNYIALNFFGAANSRRFSLDAIAQTLTAFQAAFPLSNRRENHAQPANPLRRRFRSPTAPSHRRYSRRPTRRHLRPVAVVLLRGG